jgi:flagellar assembly factor FliW
MTRSAATLAPSAPARASAPVPAVQVVLLTEPLAGFPSHRDYALVAADAAGTVFWLQSLAPDGPRFVAVPAGPFFPDYAPVLPGPVCAELGIDGIGGAAVYCLVTVPDGDVGEATANLRAPIVVDVATNRARQVVLTDGAHPIRRPLRR